MAALLGAALIWLNGSLMAAEPAPPAELWLTNVVGHPLASQGNKVEKAPFENLRADFLAGVVKIFWSPAAQKTATDAVLYLSVGEPGHWPARDWRSHRMADRGSHCEVIVPVDSLDVPLVYFVRATSATQTNISPLRLCHPRRLGLEKPTRIFWPFIEGFEEGVESWLWMAGGPQNGVLLTSPITKTGKAALAIRIPAGRNSATVGTTRLRGWHLLEHSATGFSLWIRTHEGKGRAQFTIFANAFTTNQVTVTARDDITLSSRWQQVEVPFRNFPKLPLGAVDFLAIEFLGSSGSEFLLDDMQLQGRWKLD